MDDASSTLVISSLLGRLLQENEVFILPSGRLSAIEVDALRSLCGVPSQKPSMPYGTDKNTLTSGKKTHTHQTGTQGLGDNTEAPLSDIKLVLTAADIAGPDEADMRLCIDFGTAMSKAWAAYDTIASPMVLNLGVAVGEGKGLPLPSTIFIAGSGRIFFGGAAERQHRQELETGRQRFDNIKRILSESEINQDLHEVPVENAIDPTGSGITKGDLLVLYLGWLTDHALKALREGAFAEVAEIDENDLLKLRSIRRRFAIPCFENAIEEKDGGEARSSWAMKVMKESMLRAQIIADTFSGRWDSISVVDVEKILFDVRKVDLSTFSHLLASRPTVREPIAAGASRFNDQIEEEEHRSRKFLLVVDAGAGTTDFAVFQIFSDPARLNEKVRYALIPSTVRMSRIAGNEVDAVLRPLFLLAGGLDPLSGAPRNEQDYSLIGRDLNSQMRDLKRILFSEGEVRFTFRPNVSGALTEDSVEQDSGYQGLGNKLLGIRDNLISTLFQNKADFLDIVRERNSTSGGAMPIYVLLTGGSSTVPIISGLASGVFSMDGAKFQFF